MPVSCILYYTRCSLISGRSIILQSFVALSTICLTCLTVSSFVRHIPHSPSPPTPIPIPSGLCDILLGIHDPALRWISCKPQGSNSWSNCATVVGPIPEPGRITRGEPLSVLCMAVSCSSFLSVGRDDGAVFPRPLDR